MGFRKFYKFIFIICALFVLFQISLIRLKDSKYDFEKKLIMNNLKVLKQESERYFFDTSLEEVSIYELVEKNNKNLQFKYFEDEVYPEIIYINEQLVAYSPRIGYIAID